MKRVLKILVTVVISVGVALAQFQISSGAVRFTDGTNIITAGDNANNALRVNIVAGGGGGGTSSSFGAAFPATGTAAGFNDGTNMQGARVADLDTGAGTFWGLTVNLVKRASGGPTELIAQGTMANSVPVVIASDQTAYPITGNSSDNSANSTTKLAVVPARANANVPAWTEGNQVPLSVDLAGLARVGLGKKISYQTNTGPLTGGTAVALKDLYYLFHPAANTKRVQLVAVNVNQIAGNVGAQRLELYRITAENATPGCTATTILARDPADAASALTSCAVPTGAPTRATGVYYGMDLPVYSNGNMSIPFQSPFESLEIKPLILRASVAEGYEIVQNVTTTITTAPVFNLTAIWTEESIVGWPFMLGGPLFWLLGVLKGWNRTGRSFWYAHFRGRLSRIIVRSAGDMDSVANGRNDQRNWGSNADVTRLLNTPVAVNDACQDCSKNRLAEPDIEAQQALLVTEKLSREVDRGYSNVVTGEMIGLGEAPNGALSEVRPIKWMNCHRCVAWPMQRWGHV